MERIEAPIPAAELVEAMQDFVKKAFEIKELAPADIEEGLGIVALDLLFDETPHLTVLRTLQYVLSATVVLEEAFSETAVMGIALMIGKTLEDMGVEIRPDYGNL